MSKKRKKNECFVADGISGVDRIGGQFSKIGTRGQFSDKGTVLKEVDKEVE